MVANAFPGRGSGPTSAPPKPEGVSPSPGAIKDVLRPAPAPPGRRSTPVQAGLNGVPDIPQPTDSDPPSPCRHVCRLEGEVCLGCGRRLDEIAAWSTASVAARHAILRAAGERRAAFGDEAAGLPARPGAAVAQRKKG